MFVGKPNLIIFKKKKEKSCSHYAQYSFHEPFSSFAFHDTEVRQKKSHSDFSFVVSFRSLICNTCKRPVLSWHTDQRWQLHFINNIFTLFCRRKASLGTQQRLKSRAVLMINKVLYVEAPPLGQTHYPFITVYIPFLIEKVYLSYTFHWHSAKKLITLSLRGKTTFCHDINRF